MGNRSTFLCSVVLTIVLAPSPSWAIDVDVDGVSDDEDNCLEVANGYDEADRDLRQRDTNLDGYGNLCDPDFNNDGSIDASDYIILAALWGAIFGDDDYDPDVDLDGDGEIGAPEYIILGSYWGQPPGPSGLSCAGTIPCIADRDGDGLANVDDNCIAIANPDQLDTDGDQCGQLCDGDFNSDGFVDGSDYLTFSQAYGSAAGDPDYNVHVDFDGNGAVDVVDYIAFSTLLNHPTGPSGLDCVSADPHAPEAKAGYFGVVRGRSYQGTLPLRNSRERPVDFGIDAVGTEGTVALLDGSTGEFRYTPDPSGSGKDDPFRFAVSDGRWRSEAVMSVAVFDAQGASISPGELNASTLVVYNANAPEALSLAEHYRNAREVDASHLCQVRLPIGLYATAGQMLAARQEIVEGCICPIIPAPERPTPCAVGNLAAVAEASPITHLVFMKGVPGRMFETGWEEDREEPSLDYYLSYLLYNDDTELFAPDSPGPRMAANPAEANRVVNEYAAGVARKYYSRALDAGRDRFLAYGRVEAMTMARTEDLIDRTIAAEQSGFRGNILSEWPAGFAMARELTASFDPVCTDYLIQETLVDLWPHQTCRAGTTHYTGGMELITWPLGGRVPGDPATPIPLAVNVGLLVGDAVAQNQAGFVSFDIMANWRKTGGACESLCENTADPVDCAASSTDFFRELNTECVGAAPGLIGRQLRSYPVSYYGFLPPGWGVTSGSGAAERTEPRILEGDAYQNATFTDARYLHLGVAEKGDSLAPMCPTPEGGPDEACEEPIGVQLWHQQIAFDPPLSLQGGRSFVTRFRYRTPAQFDGSARAMIQIKNQDDVWSSNVTVVVPIDSPDEQWTESGDFEIAIPEESGPGIERVRFRLIVDLRDGVRRYLDLDGVELIDVPTGDSLIPVEVGSFDPADHYETRDGDWASNAIDRLGGIGWWGSASHHVTGGFAFDGLRFFERFFEGRTLGESLLASGGGESGLIYADPLYRPSAAALFFPSEEGEEAGYPSLTDPSFDFAGLTVDSTNLENLDRILMTALHGTSEDRLNHVQWTVSTCHSLDPWQCDTTPGMWTERILGTGAIQEEPLDWSAWLDDPAVSQKLLIRLKVWNVGEPDQALYDQAYIDYHAR